MDLDFVKIENSGTRINSNIEMRNKHEILIY